MNITPEFLEQLWYGNHRLSSVLLPLGWLNAGFMKIRNAAYTVGILPKRSVDVPVIVVGNLTVGGTGKTPLVIWLSQFLIKQGYRPGIISRGYGGRKSSRPQQVRPDSHPSQVGDEPVLLAQKTRCPVAVFPNRYIAASELLKYTDCNILLCDDGLQHLAMDRDLEIAVVDGDRRFGNGRCLPAGPLREPVSRLSTVDLIVATGKAGRNEFLMNYVYDDLLSLDKQQSTVIDAFRNTTVHAVSGIGNPERFQAYLRSHNIRVIKHEFMDHHNYQQADLQFNDGLSIIMTEKDAVKCRDLNLKNAWYLPIHAEFTEAFKFRLLNLLKGSSTNG